MRLFVALVPPPEAVAELAAVAVELRTSAPGLRWVRPEQWHLTVAFLGEVEEPACDELVERLGRVARRHPPLTLSFADGGRFGGRVLWTGVRGNRAGLRGLVGSVRAAARRCRLAVDAGPHSPHLTLARAGEAAVDLAPLVEQLREWAGPMWTAAELHLLRSHLDAGPGGTAQHETVATWKLTRNGDPSGQSAPGSNKSRPS